MTKEMARALTEVKDAFSKSQVFRLRQLGNKLLGEAALRGDENLAEVSVIAYSLHKLSSKEHVAKSAGWGGIKRNILGSLGNAINSLKKETAGDFNAAMHRVISNVSETDTQLGYYMQNLYDKARVKQASRAYSLGLSLSQAAELTKADKGRLLSYIGGTKIYDAEKGEVGIGKRLEKLRESLGS